MAYFLDMDEYLELVKEAILPDYRNGKHWHPEDLATAVDFANAATAAVLAKLPKEGVQYK